MVVLELTRREARLALLKALEDKYPDFAGKLLHSCVSLIVEGPHEDEARAGHPEDLAVEARLETT